MLAETSTAVGEPDLDTGLGQASGLGQLLTGIDIRVLGAGKGPLQSLQLFGCEGGAGTALLALQRNPRLRLRVTDVRVAACNDGKAIGVRIEALKGNPKIINAS